MPEASTTRACYACAACLGKPTGPGAHRIPPRAGFGSRGCGRLRIAVAWRHGCVDGGVQERCPHDRQASHHDPGGRLRRPGDRVPLAHASARPRRPHARVRARGVHLPAQHDLRPVRGRSRRSRRRPVRAVPPSPRQLRARQRHRRRPGRARGRARGREHDRLRQARDRHRGRHALTGDPRAGRARRHDLDPAEHARRPRALRAGPRRRAGRAPQPRAVPHPAEQQVRRASVRDRDDARDLAAPRRRPRARRPHLVDVRAVLRPGLRPAAARGHHGGVLRARHRRTMPARSSPRSPPARRATPTGRPARSTT